jgi:uncharacterized DUF497 family protein
MPAMVAIQWDAGNTAHCRKHGVSTAEIEELFAGNPAVAPDLKHSAAETRFMAVGRSKAGRPLFVIFTYRRYRGGSVTIRPVMARYMHKKESDSYGIS